MVRWTIRCTASTKAAMLRHHTRRRTSTSINNIILVTANSNCIPVQDQCRVDHLFMPCTTSHRHCPQRDLPLPLRLLPCHRLPTNGITQCHTLHPMDITMARATVIRCPSTDYVSNPRSLKKTNSRYRPAKRAPSSIEFSRVQQANETLDEDLRQRSLHLFLGPLRTVLRPTSPRVH